MFNCLCIGDLHFCKRNYIYIDKIIQQIVIAANKLKPNFVIIMGDILDNHEKSNVYIYKKAIELIDKLINDKHYVVLIIGNHDRPNNTDFMTNTHFFLPLKKWENVLIIDETTDFRIDNHRIICVPYVPPGRFNEALNNINDIDTDPPTVIFCHQEFYGVNLGPIKSTKGDKWDESKPLIISGHIHNYHWLQKNILYCGSPYQIKHNDSDDKTILLLNFDNDNYLSLTRFSLNLPIKRDYYINIEDFNDNILDKLIKYQTNDDIRLIFTGDINVIKHHQKNIIKKLSNKFRISFKPDFNSKSIFDDNETNNKNNDINNNINKISSFDNIFYNIIKNNKNALHVYHDIFNI